MDKEILKQRFKLFLADRGVHYRPAQNVPSGTSAVLYADVVPAGTRPLIFDVGANVGQTCIAFRHSFPTATIHAFEPIQRIFDQLCRNVAPGPDLHCHRLALGSACGSQVIALQSADDHYTMNQVSVAADRNTPANLQETIQITTLDAFVTEQKISAVHILKTDTEGFELEVLKGAEQSLKEGRVRSILVETTLLPSKLHVPLDALRQRLEPFGFGLRGLYDFVYQPNGDLYYVNALFKANQRAATA
jgi:FkbM family methyltransferase